MSTVSHHILEGEVTIWEWCPGISHINEIWKHPTVFSTCHHDFTNWREQYTMQFLWVNVLPAIRIKAFLKSTWLQRTCACMLSHFSHVLLFVTLWTIARQAPLSMEFSSQELLFPPPGILLTGDWSHVSCRQIHLTLRHLGTLKSQRMNIWQDPEDHLVMSRHFVAGVSQRRKEIQTDELCPSDSVFQKGKE